MKDVIVTGGTGFIGRVLARHLEAKVGEGRKVLALRSGDVDLISGEETFRWCEKRGRELDVSHIFHLAAVYKAGGWPASHPATQFHSNMAINVNVLEAWKRYFSAARLTNVVSYCMYPDHDRPHPESEMYGTEPEAYLYAYAFTKKALVIGQRAYCQEFGLSGVSAVLPTVYGPGDSFREDSHVMGALIGKFNRAATEGADAVEVWGDGRQEREFLFVDDAAEGILAVADRGVSDVVNVGAGESVTIARVAETIRDVTGFTGAIDYRTDRFVGAAKRVMDSSRARTEVGWSPSVSLKEGIGRTVRDYLASRS